MRNPWVQLAFLCAIFFIYTLDRAFLGLLAIPIQEETGIGDIAFGLLNSAIFWTYALCVPFSGLVGDRFDRRRIIGIAAILWSVMAVLAGFASGFWSLLLLVSVAITAPQTLYGPAANPLIAATHDRTKALAMSLHQAAFYAGWFASGVAVAAVLAIFGSWRAAYFTFGTLGILVGAAFLLLNGRDGSVPLAQGPETAGAPTFRDSLRAFFGCPSALLAASGYVLMVFVACGYCAWGPKFVAQKFGLSPAAAGTGVMFWHYASALAAILVAGAATDRFVKRWPRFRLYLQTTVLALAAPMVAVFGFGASAAVVFAAAAAFGVLRGLFEANQFLSVFDVVSPQCRASAIGFVNVIAGTIGALAPVLLGALSQKYGLRGLEVGFALLGAALVLAAALMAFLALVTFERDRIGGK